MKNGIKKASIFLLVFMWIFSYSSIHSQLGTPTDFAPQSNPTFAEQFDATTAAAIANKLGKQTTDIIDDGLIASTTVLEITGENLTDISGIEIFANLQALYLSNNQLSSLPESIGYLDSLLEIDLTGNKLRSLPESIGGLGSLEALNLTFNQISSLPDCIGKLESLEFLSVSSNQLSSLPESIDGLDNLHALYLSCNQLSSLPESIDGLASLQTLYLSNNQLTSLPESFVNLNNLITLWLSNNLLPSNYADELNSLGMTVSGSAIIYEYQDKLKVKAAALPIEVLNQGSLANIDFSVILELESGRKLSTACKFELQGFKDENDDPVDLDEYIVNGVVQKDIKLFAQVRATGTGIFPNSDNATTAGFMQMNLQTTYFNLTFDLNGASGTAPSSQSLLEGTKTSTVADPTREGYTFKGWNTAANGSGTYWDLATSTMPANNVTLYAQWQDNAGAKSGTSAKTGDNITMIILGMIVLIAASGTIVCVMKKKKENNN